jgi:hypothetical protein
VLLLTALSIAGCGGGAANSAGSEKAGARVAASNVKEATMAKADMSWLEHAVHLPLPARDPELVARPVPLSKLPSNTDPWEIFDPRTGYACRSVSGSRDPWQYYTFIKDERAYKVYYTNWYSKEKAGRDKGIYRITAIRESRVGPINSLSDDQIRAPKITIATLLRCLSVPPHGGAGDMRNLIDVYYAPEMPGERL